MFQFEIQKKYQLIISIGSSSLTIPSLITLAYNRDWPGENLCEMQANNSSLNDALIVLQGAA
jgi:hypothetical protein